ncbi:MAG: hypothetical protein LV473_02460 [Nitrospira sp.]|nr:hypothetical protein [Nitrospira sp.]
MMDGKCTLVALLAICLSGLTVVTAAQERDLTDVSAALARRGEGLLVARCAVCHSQDLVSQQRLSRDRWLATIDKMKHWGAEISEEEADLLVRYLSARYHPDAPDQLMPADGEWSRAELLETEPEAEGPVMGIANRGAGL